MDGVASA
ncbi:hypothetical protein YPPY102_2833, partial [Yersinia pestis PY-102]